MTLKKTTKRTTKAVKLLTDPEPQFVSLVSNGANQTPFQVVKSADAPDGNEDSEVVVAGVRTTDSLTQESEDAMAGKKQSKKLVVRTDAASAETGLQKLVFSADNFDSEKAVRSYLDDNGYEGGDITQLENQDFEVVAADAEDFDGVKTVKGEDGVTRHIGETKQSEEDGETVTKGDDDPEAETGDEEAGGEPESEDPEQTGDEDTGGEPDSVAKTDGESGDEEVSIAKKYDRWWAGYSEATTIKGVMMDGVDGLPPAICEINDAMYVALRNAILAGENEKIPVITAEFGTMVSNLVSMFDFATMPDEEVQKMLGSTGDKETTQKSTNEQQTSIDVDAIVATVMKQVDEKMEALASADGLQLVSKSVENHNEVATQLKGDLDKAVKTVAEQQTSIDEMQKTIKAQAKSIEDLEGVATISRAIDEDGQRLSQVEQEQTKKTSDSSLLKNDLGFG